MDNNQTTTPNFTKQELEEICKWAEIIGYQGTARELEKALAVNRGIVDKCEAAIAKGNAEGKE